MLARILEANPTDTFIIVDGFDEAIIGLDESTMCLIYSVEKCIEIIISDNEMLLEDTF